MSRKGKPGASCREGDKKDGWMCAQCKLLRITGPNTLQSQNKASFMFSMRKLVYVWWHVLCVYLAACSPLCSMCLFNKWRCKKRKPELIRVVLWTTTPHPESSVAVIDLTYHSYHGKYKWLCFFFFLLELPGTVAPKNIHCKNVWLSLH